MTAVYSAITFQKLVFYIIYIDLSIFCICISGNTTKTHFAEPNNDQTKIDKSFKINSFLVISLFEVHCVQIELGPLEFPSRLIQAIYV